MPETYVRRHGFDWPAGMLPDYIDMTIAKKWRQYRDECGVVFPDPHVRLLDAARSLLPRDSFVVSPWTEQHAFDFVNYEKVVTWGCASSSKSNDYGLFTLMYWLTDPYDTVCLVGSTTLKALQSRTWESIVRYHSHLKNNVKGFAMPGVFSRTGYAIVNVADEAVAESQGVKASIQGRALNEGGTLQGAHLPYVLLLIDEAATLSDHSVVTTAMTNLRAGTRDFRTFLLANPEDWADPSCQYCEPPGGPEAVTVDTGEWDSTMGFRVRHHDGLKSPRIVVPGMDREYRFLTGRDDVAAALKLANGNEDAPTFWKMVRGFPRPAGSSAETVLDAAVARARRCCDAFVPTGRDASVGRAAGCDPAWSEGGDAAVWQDVDLVSSVGVPMLCFREPSLLPIRATAGETAIEQLSGQVFTRLLSDRSLSPADVAYDASGNQSLGGVVSMRTGMPGMEVNSSVRASEALVSVGGKPAREQYYDRGTEAYAVLAAFVQAGQVRGLSKAACDQICSRRWARRTKNGSALAFPLRLEPKEQWAAREGSRLGTKSPNHADAAALAALAAKERLGVLPGASAMPEVRPSCLFPESMPEPAPLLDDGGSYESAWGAEGYENRG